MEENLIFFDTTSQYGKSSNNISIPVIIFLETNFFRHGRLLSPPTVERRFRSLRENVLFKISNQVLSTH
jgi:hypothetical protein